ncbi:MAG: DUF2225 domain-containing protein [Negativicutes bacterium]|nr:DUF2225 domain-containing protein [Negativicutes bacterium]
MSSLLYSTEKTCALCAKPVTVTKVRNRLAMVKQDSDFCTYYKDLNPYYYDIWVCPNCGYAAHESYFEELPAKASTIQNFLAARAVNVHFDGVRTREQGIAVYKLALFFAEMAGLLASRLANLYLKLAWLYREGEQKAEELAALDKARTYYEQAFLKERMPLGNMSELTLEYLCGELLRRTGRIPEALNYLGKVVNNPRAKQEKRIMELARDAWNEARAASKTQTP